MSIRLVLGFMLLVSINTGCKKWGSESFVSPFSSKPLLSAIEPGLINEVSGIADSYMNAGYLWTEQDSGNPPELHLIRHDGVYLKKVHLKGSRNRDWEEMAIGNGPVQGLKYIYVADIGDNNEDFSQYDIYRFPEPDKRIDTITDFEKITFQYPDGSHDAEAMFVAENRDIYIITKRGSASSVYRIPYPQSTTAINTAVSLLALPFSGAVGAAISPDEREIMIKTYTRIYYWQGKTGETVVELLQQPAENVDYKIETQGEAICFKIDNSGFFALSEKSIASAVSLQFYKRN